MRHTLVNYDDMFSRFLFSNEASFHLSGKVNKHNVWEEFNCLLDVCYVFSDEASFHLSGKVNKHNVWEEFDYR